MNDRPEQPAREAQFVSVERSQEVVSDALGLFQTAPGRAKDQSVDKIHEEIRKAKEALKATQTEQQHTEIGVFVTEAQETAEPQAVVASIRQMIKESHDAESQEMRITPEQHPDNVGQFLASTIARLEQSVSQLSPKDPERVQRETVAQYLYDAALFIEQGKADNLRVHLQDLSIHRKSFPTALDYVLVKQALEDAVITLLIQKHTIGGRIQWRELSQELFNFSFNNRYRPDLPEDLFKEYFSKFDYERRSRKYDSPNQLQLDDPEIDVLLGPDPFKLVEDVLRQIEKGKSLESDQLAQALTSRMRTLEYHITSEVFRKQWQQYSEYHRATGRSVDQFLDEMRRKVYARLFGHNMRMAVQSADFQGIQQQAAIWGSGGFFNGLLENHAHIAFNFFEQELEQMRLAQDPETQRRRKEVLRAKGRAGEIAFNENIVDKVRLTAERVERLKPTVVEKLLEQRELYGFTDREQIEAAVNTAYNALMNTQRVAYEVARGKSPIEDMMERGGTKMGLHSFVADPIDYVASTFGAIDFHLDRFFIQSDAQKKILFGNLLSWVGHGDQDLGRQRLNDAFANYDVLSSGWRVDMITLTLEEIYKREYGAVEGKRIYDTLALGAQLKRDGKDYRWASPDKRKGHREKLENVWARIAKYRPQEIAKILAENVHYKREFKPRTGVWEYEYLETEELDHKGDKIQVRVVDPNRPNTFAEIFGGGQVVLFDEDNNPIRDYAHLDRYISKYFNAINEMLALNDTIDDDGNHTSVDPRTGRLMRDQNGLRVKKGLAAIDYSQGYAALNNEQKAMVNKVFESLVGDNYQAQMNNYFNTMRQLTDFSSGTMTVTQTPDKPHEEKGRVRKILQFPGGKRTKTVRVIDELIDNKEYEFVYQNHVRFYDDARLFELQDQDRNKFVPIAVRFSTGEGSGGRDMMARAWGDTGAANKALQGLTTMMTTLDEKVLLEKAAEFEDAIREVEGHKEATTGLFYVLGSWLNSAKAGSVSSLLGLDKLPIAASEMQRQMGLGAPSLNPQEIHHIMEEVNKIAGHYEELIPDEHIREEFKKVSGSKDFVRYLYNARVLILIMLFFLLQEMMKEAQKAEAA